MIIRGMWQVISHKEMHWTKTQKEVVLQAVHAGTKVADSDTYSEATPSGQATMVVKKALCEPGTPFALGTFVYSDFSIVPA